MAEMTEVKSLVVEMGKDFEEFKSTHAKSLKEKDALIDQKLATLGEEISKKHEAAQKALAEMEAKFSRPPLAGDDVEVATKNARDARLFFRQVPYVNPNNAVIAKSGTVEQYVDYTKAFTSYIKRGEKSITDAEFKALSVGSDPDGGYWLAPPTMSQNVVTRIFESSPVRAVASVQAISTHEYRVPEDPNELAAGWVAERAARPVTATPTVASKTITAQELYAEPQATQQILEDAEIDPEMWLSNKIGDKFARVEATSFVSGTGVGQSRGFLTYANGTTWGTIQQVGTGSSGAFSYTGLVNIITSIKDAYQGNSQWMIKRGSIAGIMLLQDGNGRFIFQPIQNGAFNQTPLLGYKINYANDMPAAAAGSLSAAFGDFKRGYQIVDRVGISILRDPYTSKPNVLFYARKRVGGDVIDFDAIKLQVLT